ncbi:hypothetical protein G7050_13040 [Dysgonomonas sp. HDW5A]|uniref:hypothetical protein n=1 Tax=Dysgonomonas sp. HDW5A TaxID=2714926 RepID=UPI00140AD8CF|nr:hypothetical protein [Dysgonomonas sp. HDW5A]QIK60708.1 hypothetical protein G7050_13040 [Dysgonomonas sp. HDW5A]
MKKSLIFILSLLSIGWCNAQVGINIKNPLGALHIDPNSDTQSDGSGDADDVIITKDGYMGIGTSTPSTYLHIKTATAGIPTSTPAYGLRLADGNEADRRALISNANGLATWGDVVPEGGISAVKSSVGITQPAVTNNILYNSSTNLTLPQGKWLVQVAMYIVLGGAPAAQFNDRIILSTTFSETIIAQTTADIASAHIEGAKYVSGIFWKYGSGGILYGTFIINNPLASTTYYYYMGRATVYGTSDPSVLWAQIGGTKGEDNIIAYRLPQNL